MKTNNFTIESPKGKVNMELSGSMIYVRVNGELRSTKEVDSDFSLIAFSKYVKQFAAKIGGRLV